MPKNVLVSSCLLGLATRYDGSDNLEPAVIDYLAANNYTPVPVCPEQLAGLPTPRLKCWFAQGDGAGTLSASGKLIDEQGQDVTETFIHGARLSYQVALLAGCQSAILKQRSPSCGHGKIYLNNQLVSGLGVTAALLKKKGLQIFSEDDLPAK